MSSLPRRRREPPPPFFTTREVSRLVLLGSALFCLFMIIARLHSNPELVAAWIGDEAAALPADAPAELRRAGARPQAANDDPDSPAGRPFNPLKLLQTDECREVNRAYLEVVLDREPIRTDELDALRQLLCVAAMTPPADLAAKSRRDVTFANLFNQPQTYRGQPIYIRGVLARLQIGEENIGKENPYGLEKYYEAWIYTDDQTSLPSTPLVVLFSSLPPGLTPSARLKENIACNAYFMKVLRYRSADGKERGAPLLVGYEPFWRPPSDNTIVSREALLLALGFIGVIVAASILFWWLNKRDEKLAYRFRQTGGRGGGIDAAAVPEFLDEGDAKPPANSAGEVTPPSEPPKPSEPPGSPGRPHL